LGLCRRGPKKILGDGYYSHTGVKLLGAILDLVSMVQTPIGAAAAVAVVAGLYFFVRWVLAD
jgi:hypothetical protein